MDPRRADILATSAFGVMLFGSLVAFVVIGSPITQGFLFGTFLTYIIHSVWKVARATRWFSDEDIEDRMGEIEESVEETVEETVEEAVEETVENVVSDVKKDVDQVQDDVGQVQEEVEKVQQDLEDSE